MCRRVARLLDRHPSTISREIRRNLHVKSYHARIAQAHANGRRSRSRKVDQFSAQEWSIVYRRLEEDWSPEQISLTLREESPLAISHETIYRHIWKDKRAGGSLFWSTAQ
jgi:IS30 family transposase